MTPMKMETNGETLRITSVQQLGEANANAFRAWVRGAFSNDHRNIEVDLAQTTFDPDAVRGAGQDWLDGRAWCNGAFHPKRGHSGVCRH